MKVKTVLIDDERPALRELEYLLNDYPTIEVIGSYCNPLIAIEEINRNIPQVVFLDINMPQLKGIDVASKILEISPSIDIIFVTAYDNYAMEAFDVEALDYLLKPLSKERFNRAVERVLKKNYTEHNIHKPNLKIKCFGTFQVFWEGQEPLKWRSKKTKELFAFLLYYNGKEISKEEIIYKLWPETEQERATQQLHNCIYYIRKSLDSYGINGGEITITGTYCLKLGAADLDISGFNEGILKIQKENKISKLEEISEIYIGDYLSGMDWQWADLKREIFLKQYSETILKLAEGYIENGDFYKAEVNLIEAFNRNPFEENITKQLMKLYGITGDKAKAKIHFSKYKIILKEELGINPQKIINKIYEKIMENKI